jgi:apolipoprotein D and lipocalin family protein
VVRNCATVSGIPQVNDGIIYLNNSNFIGDGSLIVSQIPTWLRWTHFGRNEVAVIYLNDEYLMMGTPDQKHLWIFAHNENPPLAKIQNLIEIAKYQGFSISKLIFNYPAYYAK